MVWSARPLNFSSEVRAFPQPMGQTPQEAGNGFRIGLQLAARLLQLAGHIHNGFPP